MNTLNTAAELAPLFRCSTYTFLKWKREGKITADVDTGRTILFDADKVRKQLSRISRKHRTASSNSSAMVPTY